jgi:hypothetical protein
MFIHRTPRPQLYTMEKRLCICADLPHTGRCAARREGGGKEGRAPCTSVGGARPPFRRADCAITLL